MHQYCRYCAYCIEGDCFYCTEHEEVLSERQIRRVNHCKNFTLGIDDIITGRQYKPRKPKKVEGEQLKLELEREEEIND